MISLGKVKGNKMIDMQLSNHKLQARGVRIVMEETGLDQQTAEQLLVKYGSIRKAIESRT